MGSFFFQSLATAKFSELPLCSLLLKITKAFRAHDPRAEIEDTGIASRQRAAELLEEANMWGGDSAFLRIKDNFSLASDVEAYLRNARIFSANSQRTLSPARQSKIEADLHNGFYLLAKSDESSIDNAFERTLKFYVKNNWPFPYREYPWDLLPWFIIANPNLRGFVSHAGVSYGYRRVSLRDFFEFVGSTSVMESSRTSIINYLKANPERTPFSDAFDIFNEVGTTFESPDVGSLFIAYSEVVHEIFYSESLSRHAKQLSLAKVCEELSVFTRRHDKHGEAIYFSELAEKFRTETTPNGLNFYADEILTYLGKIKL